jgi:chitodextrinase
VWSAPSTDKRRRWLAPLVVVVVLLAGAEAAAARSWSSLDQLAGRAAFVKHDWIPPSTPAGLALTRVTATSLSLSWQPSHDNRRLRGYALYRDDTFVIARSRASATFTGLTCGRAYRLGVAAVDAAGNQSDVASVTASTTACPDTLAPTEPANVTQTGATATTISLFWSPSLDDVGVAGYGLYRDGVRIGSSTPTSFVVANLACGTSYRLGIDSYDSAGNRSAVTSVFASTSTCPLVPTASSTPSPPPAPIPQATPLPPTVTPPSPPSPAPLVPAGFGVSSSYTYPWMDSGTQSFYAEKLASLGAGWFRYGFEWSGVELSRGSFRWAHLDQSIAHLDQRGIKVLGLLAYAPDWSHPGQSGDKYPPHNAGDFGRFCGLAAARYPQVPAWEVWNEPNLAGFFQPRPDAAKYVSLLKACYAEIKRVQPQDIVLGGALSGYGAYNQQAPDGTMNPITFLERMYAAGAKGHFDALSHHPYDWGVGTSYHPASSWSNLVDTNPSLRSLMIANGDADKKIWATEWGAPTNQVSEQRQADLIREAFPKWRAFAWAGPLFVYQLRDEYSERFGLTGLDWSEKPAAEAFREMVR